MTIPNIITLEGVKSFELLYPDDAFVHNHVSGKLCRMRPGSFVFSFDTAVVGIGGIDGIVVVKKTGKPPIKNPWCICAGSFPFKPNIKINNKNAVKENIQNMGFHNPHLDRSPKSSSQKYSLDSH